MCNGSPCQCVTPGEAIPKPVYERAAAQRWGLPGASGAGAVGYPPAGALGHSAGAGIQGTIDDRYTFASGAMSSGQKPRYDLIPTYALERIAHRFELGAAKYGVDNWKKGARDDEFILDRINHAIEHLMTLKDLIHSDVEIAWEAHDDDAAAVILNAIFVMEYQRAASRR